jgi:hypothetical protein
VLQHQQQALQTEETKLIAQLERVRVSLTENKTKQIESDKNKQQKLFVATHWHDGILFDSFHKPSFPFSSQKEKHMKKDQEKRWRDWCLGFTVGVMAMSALMWLSLKSKPKSKSKSKW